MPRLLVGVLAAASVVACQSRTATVADAPHDDTGSPQEHGDEQVQAGQRDSGPQWEAPDGRTDAPLTLVGRVASVEKDRLEVRTEAGRDVKLELAPDVTDGNGRPLASSDVREGAQVRASYRVLHGTNVADHLDVVPPP
jgi:hypothetical protein